MAFVKKEWKSGELGGTPITPEELNRIEQGIADNEVDFLTPLYSASSHVGSAELSESINNFYGILLVSHFSTYNVKGSMFLPSEIASQTNMPVKVHDNLNPTTTKGVNVIISNGGKTLQITQFDSASYLMSVYGIFRK